MSATKPTVIPEWARTTAHLTTPTEAKKDLGWEYEEDPSSAIDNWRTKAVGQWCRWISERFDDGASSDDLEILHPGSGKEVAFFETAKTTFYANEKIAVEFEASQTTWYLDDEDLMKLEDTGEFTLYSRSDGTAIQGARFWMNNPVRSSHDAKSWLFNQISDSFRLQSFDSSDVFEYVYWIIEFHATDPTMKFTDEIQIIPTTDGNGEIGITGTRWNEIFSDNIFETNAPYLWAQQQGGSVVISSNTPTVITPDTDLLNSGLTVQGLPFGRINTISQTGYYKFDCVFILEASIATINISISVKKNGTTVPNSTMITELLNGSGFDNTISYSFIADMSAGTDYYEIELVFVQLGHTVTMKDTSHLTAVRCQNIKA